MNANNYITVSGSGAISGRNYLGIEYISSENVNARELYESSSIKSNITINLNEEAKKYNMIKYESEENCYMCLESGIEYKCIHCSLLVHEKCLENWINNTSKRECCQCKVKFI